MNDDKLLAVLGEAWLRLPDARFCQLISAIVPELRFVNISDSLLMDRAQQHLDCMTLSSEMITLDDHKERVLRAVGDFRKRFPSCSVTCSLMNLAAWAGKGKPWLLINAEDEVILDGAATKGDVLLSIKYLADDTKQNDRSLLAGEESHLSIELHEL